MVEIQDSLVKNTKTDELDFNDYKQNYFTEIGYDSLKQYLYSLVELYINKEEYPFDIGLVLGIPFFKWANKVNSKDELLGRIKVLAQMLGIYKIELKVGKSTIDLTLEQGVN
jgi:hypothetical protein